MFPWPWVSVTCWKGRLALYLDWVGRIWFSPKSFWDTFYITLFLSHFGCIVWFGMKVTLLLCFPGTSPPYSLTWRVDPSDYCCLIWGSIQRTYGYLGKWLSALYLHYSTDCLSLKYGRFEFAALTIDLIKKNNLCSTILDYCGLRNICYTYLLLAMHNGSVLIIGCILRKWLVLIAY